VARPSQEYVQRLGLKTTLRERGVGEGPLYDAVKKLTKSLKNPSIIVVAFNASDSLKSAPYMLGVHQTAQTARSPL
jgi:hypothetical protein